MPRKEFWEGMQIRRRPCPPVMPRPQGPMPKPFSHFATKAEWDEYRRQVREGQEKHKTPF